MKGITLLLTALLVLGLSAPVFADEAPDMNRYYYNLSDNNTYLIQATTEVYPQPQARRMEWTPQVRGVKCAGRTFRVDVAQSVINVAADGSFSQLDLRPATSKPVRFKGAKRAIRLSGSAATYSSGVVGEEVTGAFQAKLRLGGRIELASRRVPGSNRVRRVFRRITCTVTKPVETYRLETPAEFL
jgi:hypothetical protein